MLGFHAQNNMGLYKAHPETLNKCAQMRRGDEDKKSYFFLIFQIEWAGMSPKRGLNGETERLLPRQR